MSSKAWWRALNGLTFEPPEATLIITSDDIFDNQYTRLFPLLQQFGMVATLAIAPIRPGFEVGVAGKLTLAQMQEMHDNGWAFVNHTVNHTNLTTLLTEEAIEDELEPVREWQVENGFDRNNEHNFIIYPNGGTNTLVLDTVRNLGFLAGRTASTPVTITNTLPIAEPLTLGPVNLNASTSLADGKELVDAIVNLGGVGIIETHEFHPAATDGLNVSMSDFFQIISYAAKKRDQGRLRVLTLPDWYALTFPE